MSTAPTRNKLALGVVFFIESEWDPEKVAREFGQGLSGLGGPVLEAARQFPGGEVTGADTDSIREATPEEIAAYFEE